MNSINFAGVLAAAIASMIIGSVWYSSALFGGDSAKQKGMGKAYLITFIGNLVTAYVLANFIGNPGMVSAGAAVGFWAWLGFLAPIALNHVVWENKPIKQYWISTLQHLVSFVVMGSVIVFWG